MLNTIDPEPYEVIPNRSWSYMPVPGGFWKVTDTDYTHLVGAGSVFSTARDLFQFLRAIKANKLGEIDSANLLAKPVAFENGLTNGYRAFIQYDKAKDVSIIFCGNSLTGAAESASGGYP